MLFEFSDEQLEFRTVVSRFLNDMSPSREVRRLMETEEGYDPVVWKKMSDELGLQALIIPEEYGGSGGSLVDLIGVFEETGYALMCAPYFSTIGLAANILLQSQDDEAKAEYLPEIASGLMIGTAAVPLGSPQSISSSALIFANGSGKKYFLDGVAPVVMDAHVSDLLIVIANTSSGPSLFVVRSKSPGVSTRQLSTGDLTRKFARLTLTNSPGRLIGREGGSLEILRPAIAQAYVCLALEQVGGAQKCLDMAVDYANERTQFGRTIGSFQAIKHMCADTLLEVESAKSASRFAAWTLAESGPENYEVASLAKACSSEAYILAASNNIQIHGGIGFTWELDCHLYYKRAKSSEVLLGMPRHHRAAIADCLMI